ncbi:CamS family sex pheromone protein [Enterococcus canintestini]|uniref:CamS family sex pheromone protein n=1 Tax=Enterococcus canintestini TaxID=317010 RepID=A0A267HWL3_9ENTE|nr:CamS family sex pheromone protein [Enterococcus canintestini]PAB02045.1 hypothetical protein AKL21_00585 [Enterococcus canintestini]
MKIKSLFLTSAMLLLLSGCGNLDKGVSNVDNGNKSDGGNMTTGRIDRSEYQAIINDGRYKTSAARELNATKLNSGYNQDNFESGLLRLSHQTFSPDKYFFQEGQKLDYDTIEKWLARNSDDNNQGLNPADESQPIIFQQLMEQDFLKEDGKTLAGMSLGFAFNSVYYGNDSETSISRDELMANARKTINAVLTRVRKMEGLKNIPIVVGIFEQASKENINGGNYIYTAVSKDGGTTIADFKAVNESHLSLPVASEVKNIATQDGMSTKFNSFQAAVQNFFPNLVGVTGQVYYVDEQVENLTINIETKYYSKTEITSFTQYVGKQVESIFDSVAGNVEVQINSVEGPQAFVAKKPEQKEIISYIFN